MDLRISQTYSKIEVNRTPHNLEMSTQNARLEFRQKHAKINIETELPRVEIDQYEAFASAGLKGNVDLQREGAQLGYQQVMAYIGKMASDGDMLAAIENGGDPIASIAERDAYPEHEFGLDFLPKTGPKITVRGGVQFDPEKNGQGVHNGVESEYTRGDVNIQFSPSKVEVYLKQKNSINIEYVGKNFNTVV